MALSMRLTVVFFVTFFQQTYANVPSVVHAAPAQPHRSSSLIRTERNDPDNTDDVDTDANNGTAAATTDAAADGGDVDGSGGSGKGNGDGDDILHENGGDDDDEDHGDVADADADDTDDDSDEDETEAVANEAHKADVERHHNVTGGHPNSNTTVEEVTPAPPAGETPPLPATMPKGELCQLGALTSAHGTVCPILVSQDTRCKAAGQGKQNPLGIVNTFNECAVLAAELNLTLFVWGKHANKGICEREDTNATHACVGENCCSPNGYKDGDNDWDLFKFASA